MKLLCYYFYVERKAKMSERYPARETPISASVLGVHPRFPEGEIRNNTVEYLAESIKQFLSTNNINPENIVLAGYREGGEKVKGDMSWDPERDKPLFFFGNLASLDRPDTFTDDAELQEEHWVVNPLMHALRGGKVGIYLKSRLEEYGERYLEGGYDDQEVEEFGTYAFHIDPNDVEAAKIAELNVASKR